MGVDQLSAWSQGNDPILGNPIGLGFHSDIIHFGALWIGSTRSRPISGSLDSREFLETKRVMVEYCSMLPLLLICLPLISTPVLAKLAGTQASFSKTMKHKRLLRLCFESTGFSSDWVAANYPPCNYGGPRSKQMGKSFVFKWRRNQYAGRKGSLFIWTDSRWRVAKRRRAEEPGLALDLSAAHRPEEPLRRQDSAGGRGGPQRPLEVSLPTLTSLGHQVLLFCCCSTLTSWCVLLKNIQGKGKAKAPAIWQTSTDSFDHLKFHKTWKIFSFS